MIKKATIIMFFMLCLLSLSGCFNSRSVEDFAYVTAIGLDLSDDNNLELTVQISIPNSINNSGSEGNQSSKTETVSVKCTTINSGLSLINSYVSKQIDLSHCKAIIISSNLASTGITPYINTFSNNVEIRPNCNIIISKCSAKEYLQNSKPTIESLTSKYYEIAIKSSYYTGYIPSTTLVEFVGNLLDTTIQSSAILCNTISSENAEIKPNNNYSVGNMPIEGKQNIEAFGTAVFRDGKLIGELTGFETLLHLMVSNELKECTITIPPPNENEIAIDLTINQEKKNKIKVNTNTSSPKIDIEIFLEGYGLSLPPNLNYNSQNGIEEINKIAESFLEKELENYLYKTSKEFNSDIDGFGKKAITHFLTIDKWNNYNWLDNYKNAEFNIIVHVNIKGSTKFDN